MPVFNIHFYFVFLIIVFYLYVWLFCLHVYLCTVYVTGALRGHKRVLEALQLVLRVVSQHVGAGYWTWLLWKNSWYS